MYTRRPTRQQLPDVGQIERRLSEAYEELSQSFVDPRGAWCDDDGTPWMSLALNADQRFATGPAFTTEAEHREIRAQCRALAVGNEFAINAHENRISYIVGVGHSYVAAVHKNASNDTTLAAEVQDFLDEFVECNAWQRRQQEIVLRCDRDGEAFVRVFTRDDGMTLVRFVEPMQVTTPAEFATDPTASFGIRTDRDDVETVLEYFIDGQPVDPAYIQHRKTNVDFNVKRGLPLLYPVRKNLRRIDKLLRNMTIVAEIQSAIALVRRHRNGNRAALQQFISQHADTTSPPTATGGTVYGKTYAPGTILDTHADVEYEFPVAGVNAGNFVTILQAELRAVAARLVMPEFMFTADASNANYSSTLVAESPAVRMFERVQAQQSAQDIELLWRAVTFAVGAGRLPAAALDSIDINVVSPSVHVRDRLQDAQLFKLQHDAGILSKQTWAQQSGLDFEQERAKGAAPATMNSATQIS